MKEENTYKILKGVKAPERKYRTSNSKLTETLRSLKVGECFDYPFEGKFYNVRSACYIKAKTLGIKLSIPGVDKSPLRVWRVK
jgi:hypothetical protein